MIPRRFLLAMPALATPARAQVPPVRIGWLTAQREASLATFIPALRLGLAERNLVEGRDIEILFRFGDDSMARVPDLLGDLLRAQVRVLVVQGAAVAQVVRGRPPVPVAFVVSSDPVAAGLAESLSRPPAGVTGITFLSAELNAKRVELLRELRPHMTRLAVLSNPTHPGDALEREAVEGAAARLGLAVQFHHARTAEELQTALAGIAAGQAEAITVFSDGFALQNRAAIARFAMDRRMPLAAGWRAFAEAGALLSYGPRLDDSYRRLAHFVARILRGTPPEDMPIERPRVFELAVNLQTAAAIGTPVPTSLLARADLVLE